MEYGPELPKIETMLNIVSGGCWCAQFLILFAKYIYKNGTIKILYYETCITKICTPILAYISNIPKMQICLNGYD